MTFLKKRLTRAGPPDGPEFCRLRSQHKPATRVVALVAGGLSGLQFLSRTTQQRTMLFASIPLVALRVSITSFASLTIFS